MRKAAARRRTVGERVGVEGAPVDLGMSASRSSRLDRIVTRISEQYTLEIAVSQPGGRLVPLGGTPGRQTTTLDQLREFRARLLYAGGRRPAFQSPLGRYVDPDPADENAYHIVANDRSSGLIGCIRLAKAELLRPSAVQSHLGDRAARVVAEVDATPSQILEAGRFIVSDHHRGQSLATGLILACIALAQHVGRPVIWGISGTRDRQHLLFQRFGSRVLNDSTAYVAKYDDELCVGVFDRRTLGSELNAAIERLRGVLFIDGQAKPPGRKVHVNTVRERYEPAVAEARRAMERHPRLLGLLTSDQPADLLRLLLIRYNAHGVRMTQQVESWIDRAGKRCAELGWADLGTALRAHARSEAGHEKLMEEDTRVLVSKWNAEHTMQLDAEALLASSPLYSTRKYIQLHEDSIASDRPYCQVAIEYEIERLSVVVGPAILSRTSEAAGGQGISFLAEHVELDQDHTAFDEQQLQLLLDQDDTTLVPLVESGRMALQYYLGFILECIELAEADYVRSQQS